jgi:hypothetical protein
MTQLAGIAVIVFVMDSTSLITAQIGKSGDEAAIHSVLGRLQSGWNSHDMELYMSAISSDANFVNVNGWWWQGHDEIKFAHVTVELSRFLRQPVKTQNPLNGELCHGVVSTKLHA